jgi:hypothetical protein
MSYQNQFNQNPYLAQMGAGANVQFDAASISIEYQARNRNSDYLRKGLDRWK